MVFKKIRNSVTEKNEQREASSFQKKIEKELSDHFNKHAKQVIKDLTLINESPQLLNAIEIGKAFRTVCEKIGKDPEIGSTKYLNFLNLVRQKDREVEKNVDGMKYRFDYENSKKFRVKANRSTRDIEQVFPSLKAVYADLQKMEEEKRLSKEQKISERQLSKKQREDEKEQSGQPKWLEIFDLKDGDYYRSRGESIPKVVIATEWAKSKLYPEQVSKNIDLITKFRKSKKPEELEKFVQPLTQKQELSILGEYFKVNQLKILSYEQKGFYNHTTYYCTTYLKFIEELANNVRSGSDFQKFGHLLLPKLREKYANIEDWLQRVERKYEIPSNLNPNEGKVDTKAIEAIIKSFMPMREHFIRAEEDKRILKHLLNQAKDQLKAEKQKERQIEKDEKNRIKAEESARKEKERQIEKDEKNRIKAEESARKEEERRIRKEEKNRIKAEESARKEKESQTKKKQLDSLIEKERLRLKEKDTENQEKKE